jgi:hypothetical protein
VPTERQVPRDFMDVGGVRDEQRVAPGR